MTRLKFSWIFFEDARFRAVILLVISSIIGIVSAADFLEMHKPDLIYPGPGVTSVGRLSDWAPDLAGTPGDTDIYYLKGSQPGARYLVLGGTHNDEMATPVAAITLIENAVVTHGELIVIPRANASGATYTQEMVGTPYFIELETPGGTRRLRSGSRYLNAVDQFPDPDVFTNVSGASYPGPESRNLNRVHPGRNEGHLIEQVSHAMIGFIHEYEVDILLDLHEAVPEHYVVNCMVGHDRAMELVALTLMGLQMQGLDINMYQSPSVYGFSHRGIGDNTDAMVVLAETTNIIQGSFRGKPTQELLHTGKDPFYDILASSGKIFVDYDSQRGISLSERVGRHMSTVMELSRSYAYFVPDNAIVIENVPELADLMENGIEYYLQPNEG